MPKSPVIICRCEDITRDEIHALLEQGFTTFEDLKRQLRVGMVPCQGSTCTELIQREIASFLHIKVEDVAAPKVRPLTAGVKLKAIKEASDHDDK